MTILHLIGPEDRYEFDWKYATDPPAVLFAPGDRVWVRAANGNTYNYFEQLGWWPIPSMTDDRYLRRVDNAKSEETRPTDSTSTKM